MHCFSSSAHVSEIDIVIVTMGKIECVAVLATFGWITVLNMTLIISNSLMVYNIVV